MSNNFAGFANQQKIAKTVLNVSNGFQIINMCVDWEARYQYPSNVQVHLLYLHCSVHNSPVTVLYCLAHHQLTMVTSCHTPSVSGESSQRLSVRGEMCRVFRRGEYLSVLADSPQEQPGFWLCSTTGDVSMKSDSFHIVWLEKVN